MLENYFFGLISTPKNAAELYLISYQRRKVLQNYFFLISYQRRKVLESCFFGFLSTPQSAAN